MASMATTISIDEDPFFGYYANVSARAVAGVMAFGSGVLLSALSFELMQEAFE